MRKAISLSKIFNDSQDIMNSLSITDIVGEKDIQEVAERRETINILSKVQVATHPKTFWLGVTCFLYMIITPASMTIIKLDQDKHWQNRDYSVAMLLFVLNCTNLLGYSIAAMVQKVNPLARWTTVSMAKLLAVGMIKALATCMKTIVFVKLPVESSVAFNYTCIVWISIFTVFKERGKAGWVSAMPVIAIIFGITSYVCLTLEGSNMETQLWAVLGLVRPFLDAINAYLVADIFNTDFAEWSQTERGFAFVFVQAITCFATTPLECLAKYYIADRKDAFDARNFTPFVGWSMLTPSTIVTFGVGCICLVKLSDNAVLKTVASYAGELLQVLMSFALFTKEDKDKFRPVSFFLMCTLLLLSVDYKLGYAAHKHKLRLQKLVQKLEAALAVEPKLRKQFAQRGRHYGHTL